MYKKIGTHRRKQANINFIAKLVKVAHTIIWKHGQVQRRAFFVQLENIVQPLPPNLYLRANCVLVDIMATNRASRPQKMVKELAWYEIRVNCLKSFVFGTRNAVDRIV
jgi:hypothetical protein